MSNGLLPSSSSSPSPPSALRSLDTILSNLPRTARSTRRTVSLVILFVFLSVLGFGMRGTNLTEVHSTLFRPSSSPIVISPVSSSSSGQSELDIASRPLPLKTPTRDRLIAWANAPGGRGEIPGEIELGGMYLENLVSCSNVWPSHSLELEKNNQHLWRSLNRSTLHHHRTRLIDNLVDLESRGVMERYGKGRGIVLTAGNSDTLQRVLYTLRMLRKTYHSTLPVQIYHFPSEKPPADSELVKEARELGAELVEAAGTTKDPGRRKNYHLKAIAIVQCPWREVLYLDSDNIPTRDPEYMFEAEPYKRLRAMFWPDYWKSAASNPIWAILGVRCRDEWEMEAGQILIDKKYHLDAMLLSQDMLTDWAFWFGFSDGDKDIFRFAFLALRKRWAVPGRYLGVGGLPSATASGSFCGLTMMQYDHLGAPLFVHYNLLKQVGGGIYRGFSWGRTKQFPLFLAAKHDPQPNSTIFEERMKAIAQDAEDPDFKDELEKVRGYGDTDCDMLADADDLGRARAPASEEIRRRAATERGSRAFFHGGWSSAFCVDARYDDPRPDSARLADDVARDAEHARLVKVWTDKGYKPGDEGWEHDPPNMGGESPLGIKWGELETNFEIAQWGDDPLLRDFENQIYDLGFVPSGQGF
ncbi:mannosyltransferase putative-domain-containing protein [Mrakia frigida]|uniref:mannosyltransferase putative-domain-containing protein n=1 Tax=Mrakia frigida TaxID=29902 RepID=UPI003FCC0B77